jgi:hypothetical protein
MIDWCTVFSPTGIFLLFMWPFMLVGFMSGKLWKETQEIKNALLVEKKKNNF